MIGVALFFFSSCWLYCMYPQSQYRTGICSCLRTAMFLTTTTTTNGYQQVSAHAGEFDCSPAGPGPGHSEHADWSIVYALHQLNSRGYSITFSTIRAFSYQSSTLIGYSTQEQYSWVGKQLAGKVVLICMDWNLTLDLRGAVQPLTHVYGIRHREKFHRTTIIPTRGGQTLQVLVCYQGRGGRPGPGGVQGKRAPSDHIVHGKWCDMWEKWTVRLELLPTTLRPTEADTHRTK